MPRIDKEAADKRARLPAQQPQLPETHNGDAKQACMGLATHLELLEWALIRLVASCLPASALLRLTATCTAAASAGFAIDLSNAGEGCPPWVVRELAKRILLVGVKVGQ
jgi:hypothetical protein